MPRILTHRTLGSQSPRAPSADVSPIAALLLVPSPLRERVRVRGKRGELMCEMSPIDSHVLPLTPALSRKGRGRAERVASRLFDRRCILRPHT